jgi:hypothetical protein
LRSGHHEKDLQCLKRKEIIMPVRNKSKRTYRRKNIVGNFRGSEDIFMTKVRDGFIEFLKSPFKRYWWS